MKKIDKYNYFSTEMNMEYMSASQFKDFVACENKALAKAKGEYIQEKTPALLFGSYVDAFFSGELDEFIHENQEMFNKNGELKAPYKNIHDVIKTIKDDPLMMNYLGGAKQVIMAGTINDVPYKIKIDSFLKDVAIVDQKIISSISELTWKENDNGRYSKVDFIEAFGYDIQGAIYQEIVYQNTGKKLPFILAVATKEENPDKALIQIDQEYLDRALSVVKELSPRYHLIKKGLVEPCSCGKCPCCRKNKKIEGVISYKELFNKDSVVEE